jgi:hypothetical protein
MIPALERYRPGDAVCVSEANNPLGLGMLTWGSLQPGAEVHPILSGGYS